MALPAPCFLRDRSHHNQSGQGGHSRLVYTMGKDSFQKDGLTLHAVSHSACCALCGLFVSDGDESKTGRTTHREDRKGEDEKRQEVCGEIQGWKAGIQRTPRTADSRHPYCHRYRISYRPTAFIGRKRLWRRTNPARHLYIERCQSRKPPTRSCHIQPLVVLRNRRVDRGIVPHGNLDWQTGKIPLDGTIHVPV